MVIANQPYDKDNAEFFLARAKVSVLTAKILSNKYKFNIEDREYATRCRTAKISLDNGDYKLSMQLSGIVIDEVKIFEELDSIGSRFKNLELYGINKRIYHDVVSKVFKLKGK